MQQRRVRNVAACPATLLSRARRVTSRGAPKNEEGVRASIVGREPAHNRYKTQNTHFVGET